MIKLIYTILILAVLVTVSAAVVKLVSRQPNTASESSSQESSVVLSQNIGDVERNSISINNQDYELVWAKVSPELTSLIANFQKKEVAKNVNIENDCSFLISGGFYTNENELNQPIGYFEAESEVLSGFRENRLLNGIFSINELGIPRITREVPEDPLVSAIQTGPILVENDAPVEAVLETDKNARRMVAVVTAQNELIFMAIYSGNSTFTGPTLSEMSEVVSAFEDQSGVDVADAINLDGGAASAFYASGFTLSEFSPVGSFFCVRQ